MRVIVKGTECPWCLLMLVVMPGKITCEGNCDLPQNLPWNNETVKLLQPVITYQRTLVGDRQ